MGFRFSGREQKGEKVVQEANKLTKRTLTGILLALF